MSAPSAGDSRALIESDVCVIGAGPAGIAFAREWIGSPMRVCLLESGEFDREPRVQELDKGSVDSSNFGGDALERGRQRQFGGSSNLWLYDTKPSGGRRFARSLPPEQLDLEPSETPHRVGWPFTLESLRSHYERAQATWNGGAFDYSVSSWADATTSPLKLPGGSVITKVSQHGPADVFSLRYRDDLLASENVTVLVGSTAARLEWDEHGRSIRRVHVVRADGTRFAVTARIVVLAGGGIENVQLLLSSDQDRPGTARANVNLGRHVTDHPEFRMGTIEPRDRDIVGGMGLYDLRWVGRWLVGGFLTLTEERKRSDRLLNLSAALTPQPAGFGSPAHRSIWALMSLRRGERPARLGHDIRTIAAAPRDTIAVIRRSGSHYHEYLGGWSRPGVDRRSFTAIEVHGSTEQSSDAENRITLGDRRDRIGRRRTRLHWRWSDDDRSRIQRSIQIMADDLEGGGIGRFSQWVEFDGPGRPVWDGIHHPMGGTRMHADPRHGVVDTDGRVHGADNLYVAGSSVFPTGHGYANPTLTILALAIRLADHVKAVLA